MARNNAMSGKKINANGVFAERVCEEVFALSEDIRYAAVYLSGKLRSVSRPNLSAASSWESDKYEEIIVNPTMLELLRQRANIDCGGIRDVIVEYGDHTQFVHPIKEGHISVGFEPKSKYARLLPRIRKLLSDKNLM